VNPFQGRKREGNIMQNLTLLFSSPERESVYWETEYDSCSGKIEFIKF